ncbi:YidC/Oxa1 family membrane protein insertase [Patescibacteria group bacterium]|nr:YidC/Oxa1 family membrane protein insertase [Patescibacteria group bacterium]
MSLTSIFDFLFYEPILKALTIIQSIIPGHDFGWAVIILTILIRILLWPLASKSIKSQKDLQELQPEMSAIKEKFKDQKEKQAQAMMELYKNKKINPVSGCLPVLIQFPILIALYYALMEGLAAHDINTNFMFLGILDLTQKSIVLAILTGILQYYQTKMIMVTKKEVKEVKEKAIQIKKTDSPGDFSQIMNKQMLYVMPFVMAFVAFSLPAGIALYLAITTAFSIVQQHWTMKKPN